MTDINDDDISCEYCNIGFTGLYLRAIQQKVFNTKDGHLDCVWRKIEDRSDGTLNKVWCCEPCYTDPDDGADGQIIYEIKQMRLKFTVATVDYGH